VVQSLVERFGDWRQSVESDPTRGHSTKKAAAR
jgi:hypothetical protein